MADGVSYYSFDNIEDFAFISYGGDRKYNADHLCEWLSTTSSDGVVPAPSGQLKVVPKSGMVVTLNAGKGLIQGHSMKLVNNIDITINASSGNVNFPRIDIIGFRIDYTNRRVEPFYKVGTAASSPTPPALVKDENKSTYYELCLAEISVPGNATSITASNITDTRDSDKCGFVINTATVYKTYVQSFKTTASTSTFNITVDEFNEKVDIIKIRVNGLVIPTNTYTVLGRKVTLNSPILTNNNVEVEVTHFYDATGMISNTLPSLTSTIDNVLGIKKYYYFCTGTDDNKKLSAIAQNFLAGTGDFAGIDANAQMEIIVCGDCGVTGAYSGDGTSSKPYTYFAFGRATTSTRTIYFNFGNCSQINVPCYTTGGTYNTIFSGADINIRNCRLNVTRGSNVDIFNGTNIHCEDSEFWMTTTNDCCVGKCCGQFDNVRTSITSTAGNAFGFYGNGNLMRVNGGTHYAWTAGTDKEAVCFYVQGNQTANVLFLSMVNCPQTARDGYTQTDTIKVNSGYATIMQSAIWKAATLYSTTNCIAYGNVIISKN